MKPEGLKTKIFLDGGNAKETSEVLDILGFLDGQTTNPTLISKNPDVERRIKKGDFFNQDEILTTYERVVRDISQLIPEGSVSIEVNADKDSTPDDMLDQARNMFSWVPNGHVKFPTIPTGLRAAELAIHEGMRVNMTLCFTQEQAAAVHAATRGAERGNVFVSPFVGRIDGIGYDGMGLVRNILEMYRKENSHVELLAASVRHMDHLMMSLRLEADIVTCPFQVLKQWAEGGTRIPDETFEYDSSALKPVPYRKFDLTRPWQEFTFEHELIDKGLDQFAQDWLKLVGRTVTA